MASYNRAQHSYGQNQYGGNGGQLQSDSFNRPLRKTPQLQNPQLQISQIETGPQSPVSRLGSNDRYSAQQSQRTDLPMTPPTPPVPSRSAARSSQNPRFSFTEEEPADTQLSPVQSPYHTGSQDTSQTNTGLPAKSHEPPPLRLFQPNGSNHAGVGQVEPPRDTQARKYAPYVEDNQNYNPPSDQQTSYFSPNHYQSSQSESPQYDTQNPESKRSDSTYYEHDMPRLKTTGLQSHSSSNHHPLQTSRDSKPLSPISEKSDLSRLFNGVPTGGQTAETRSLASVAHPPSTYQRAYAPDSIGGPNSSSVPSIEEHQPGQIVHPNMRIGTDRWRHGLCDCGDVPTCCTGFWCPCILYGQTQYRLAQKSDKKDPTDMLGYRAVNGNCALFAVACGLQWALTAFQHTRIHKTYEIPGSLTSDILASFCCYSCMLMANEREVRDRENEARRNAGPVRASTMPYKSPGGMQYA